MEVTGFRIFRNRIRVMTRLENYHWYFRLTSFLTRRFPYLASDLMVVARRKQMPEKPKSAIKEPVAA